MVFLIEKAKHCVLFLRERRDTAPKARRAGLSKRCLDQEATQSLTKQHGHDELERAEAEIVEIAGLGVRGGRGGWTQEVEAAAGREEGESPGELELALAAPASAETSEAETEGASTCASTCASSVARSELSISQIKTARIKPIQLPDVKIEDEDTPRRRKEPDAYDTFTRETSTRRVAGARSEIAGGARRYDKVMQVD
uniref:Uncharacterized protein n=1 Tax=Coccolithus braarudii TaxID=221442 RepID=A0A7S0PY69_9EUKA